MGKILRFRLKERPGREQARQWLRANVSRFPAVAGVGPDLFHGWRFVCALDGQVYFANCVERGISEESLQEK